MGVPSYTRDMPDSGLLLVLSGPSGVGKTSLARQVLGEVDGLFSVSVTTRPQSPQETQGVDYHFIDDETFLTMVESNELLEHAEVFGRHRYGTPRAPVEVEISAGRVVILDIDVQGAQQIRTSLPQALMLFIEPPDEGDLESRLRSRGRDEEDAITRRLAEARKERLFAHESGIYDGFVVNGNLEAAASEILRHISDHRG